MPSRAFHTKSRRGCDQCKQRRVKCDYRVGQCSRCEKRGQTCVYGYLDPKQRDPVQQKPRPRTPSPLPDDYDEDVLRRNSLRKTNTSLDEVGDIGVLITLDVEDTGRQHWDPIVRSEVQRYSFLQKGFHALILLYRQGSQAVVDAADHAEALRNMIAASNEFRQESASNDFCQGSPQQEPPNKTLCVVFGMLVLVFEIRMAASTPTQDAVISVINALRSGANMAYSVAPQFVEDKASKYCYQNDASLIDPMNMVHIEQLEHKFVELVEIGAARNIHLQTVLLLKIWFLSMDGYPQTWLHLLSWPAALDDEFIECLQCGDQMAWVIVFYWVHFTSRRPKSWFMELWASQVRPYMYSALDPEWQAFASWAQPEYFSPTSSQSPVEFYV